jgi:hypothetical protein
MHASYLGTIPGLSSTRIYTDVFLEPVASVEDYACILVCNSKSITGLFGACAWRERGEII